MYFFMYCNLLFIFLCFFSLVMFVLSIYMYMFKIIFLLDLEIFMIYGCKLNFPVYMDFFSSLFLSLVLFISSLIMIYSKIYMEVDLYKVRFIYILTLFVMSMGMFVICPNLISLLLGWDGLGLVSYCLIIHYQNFNSDISGMLTVLTNRIGDSFLIISICLFFNMNSWNFLMLLNWDKSFWLILVMVLASITKSAQIPFSSWLPAAMAAPTPVSSLVHSSTLVTAGVFLMIRFHKFLVSFKFLMYFLLTLSLLTLCMAGMSANLEMDFKKIIALSTLSQLGMMMSSLSVGFKDLAFFHLVMHALFKAMMFMCSGNLIHLNFNNQDLRFYGKSMFLSPFTFSMFILANLSLCGLPFLCGFYSKDLILEIILMENLNLFFLFLFLIGTCFTILYTFRVLSFSMKFYMNFYCKFLLGDKNKIMNFCMFPLFLFSVTLGLVFSNFFLYPSNSIILPFSMKILILLICLISLIVSFFLKDMFLKLKNVVNSMIFFEFMNSLMFMTYMSKKLSTNKTLNMSKDFLKVFSDGWIEFMYGLFLINFVFSNLKELDKQFLYKKIQDLMIFSLFIFIIWLI